MADEQFHQLHPDEFTDAAGAALAGVYGYLNAKGAAPEPAMAETLNAALHGVFADVFNAGFTACINSPVAHRV